MRDPRVTGPDEPAEVLAYPGRCDLDFRLRDLHFDDGHRAALAVLTEIEVRCLAWPHDSASPER